MFPVFLNITGRTASMICMLSNEDKKTGGTQLTKKICRLRVVSKMSYMFDLQCA